MAYRHCGAPRCVAASLIATILHVALSATAHASPVDTPVSPGSERPAQGDVGGLFGALRIGAFGGVGFPRPLSVEGMVKFADVVGLGLEYGALPDITVSGVTASLSAIDVDLRVFPWRGGFFVGVAMGRQELGATATSVLPMGLGSLTERVSADTWSVNPRIRISVDLAMGAHGRDEPWRADSGLVQLHEHHSPTVRREPHGDQRRALAR